MDDSTPLSLGASAPGESPDSSGVPRGRRIGEILFAAGTILLGVYALIGAAGIRIPGSTNTLGPQAFPYAVGAILTVTGVVVVVLAIRGSLGVPETGEDIDPNVATDWITVAKLVGIFAAHAFLIPVIGWPLAAGLLFAVSAVSLQARRWWHAALGGLGLGLVVQFIFGTLLGLSLPPGPLLDWIPFF
jgi:putative tricarboxylic transport membrane protein